MRVSFPVRKSTAFVFILLGVVLLALCFLIVTTPHVDELTKSISEDLRLSAGSKYSESSVDALIVSVVRGKNVKTSEFETYIGFAGRIYQADAGILCDFADVVLWLPALLEGTWVTISLAITSTIAGILLSVLLALAKLSHVPLLKTLTNAYIFIFRGSPLLMQLFFIYYALPQISDRLVIESKFLSAFIAYSLNLAAYFAEVVRAAIESIDKGQLEAARSLGFSKAQAMRYVIIPQAIRNLLPPSANQFIMAIKDVSITSLIALGDVSQVTRAISSSTGSALVFLPALVIYLLLSAVFTDIFSRLEKKYSAYL